MASRILDKKPDRNKGDHDLPIFLSIENRGRKLRLEINLPEIKTGGIKLVKSFHEIKTG